MRWLALAAGLLAGPALLGPATAGPAMADVAAKAPGSIRFATFNAALNEREAGGIVRRLAGGTDAQARLVAETIQRVRPDVLLLQEIDRDAEGRSLALFADDYLGVPQNGAELMQYPYRVFPESNTGVPTGVDVDGDGEVDGPGDAKGFGFHPGQYAFALLSRLPLGAARTFGDVLWRDVPGNLVPAGRYSEAALEVLPLSSKTHLVVPVDVGGTAVTILAAHPTPPVFDDASDFNGRRNADEIGLLRQLLADAGEGARAVVMGDLNADPNRGDARPGAIAQLLDDPRINDVVPTSSRGDVTASFNGGMRVDYVLPTTNLRVTGSGVFWPGDGDPLAPLDEASDHRLVWVDVAVP